MINFVKLLITYNDYLRKLSVLSVICYYFNNLLLLIMRKLVYHESVL